MMSIYHEKKQGLSANPTDSPQNHLKKAHLASLCSLGDKQQEHDNHWEVKMNLCSSEVSQKMSSVILDHS